MKWNNSTECSSGENGQMPEQASDSKERKSKLNKKNLANGSCRSRNENSSWEPKGTPPMPPPPRNKAYEPLVSLNKALFIGGGYLRFP